MAAMAALVVAFAALVTMHVAIAAGLASRPPRWRAIAAVVVPPLAPYWAFRDRMPVRAVLWLASAAAYVGARWATGR